VDPDALRPNSWPEVEPWTPAHQAVEVSDYETLSVLLDAGADPDEVFFELTLLTHAIDLEGDSHLHTAGTAIVLAYGADPRLPSAVCQRADFTADRRELRPRASQAAAPALPRTGGSFRKSAWKWSRVFR